MGAGTPAPLYPGLKCLEDPVLCPMDGRCPRCTASFNRRMFDMLGKAYNRRGWTISWAELELRNLLASMLEDSEPDFDRCRQIEDILKILGR